MLTQLNQLTPPQLNFYRLQRTKEPINKNALRYKWSFQLGPLPSNVKVMAQKTLLIDNVAIKNAGIYTCEVSSYEQTRRAHGELKVICKFHVCHCTYIHTYIHTYSCHTHTYTFNKHTYGGQGILMVYVLHLTLLGTIECFKLHIRLING